MCKRSLLTVLVTKHLPFPQTVCADCLGTPLKQIQASYPKYQKENRNLMVAVFFLVREAGLEPARPE